MQSHPRGRGFSILSRLARERQTPEAAATVAKATPQPEPQIETQPEVRVETQVETQPEADEWRAPVLPFDRPHATPAPRHRRDVGADESARRSS